MFKLKDRVKIGTYAGAVVAVEAGGAVLIVQTDDGRRIRIDATLVLPETPQETN